MCSSGSSRFGLFLVMLFVVGVVTECLVHWTSDQAVLVLGHGQKKIREKSGNL